MRIFSKFSMTEAFSYAFNSYIKNWRFFAKLFIFATIHSAVSYFGRQFLPELFSTNLIFVNGIVEFFWSLLFTNLLIKNYYQNDLLRFNDLFKYESNFGGYFLYFIFDKVILYLPQLFINMPYQYGFAGWLLLISVCLVFAYISIEYSLGRYLILDRDITFRQVIRTVPYLVYGEKKKILWTYALGWFVLFFLWIPLSVLGSRIIFGRLDQANLLIIVTPILVSLCYPIMTLINISVYKQLMANADEEFKTGLLEIEAENNAEDEEIEEE